MDHTAWQIRHFHLICLYTCKHIISILVCIVIHYNTRVDIALFHKSSEIIVSEAYFLTYHQCRRNPKWGTHEWHKFSLNFLTPFLSSPYHPISSEISLFILTVSPPIGLFCRHRITPNRPFCRHPQSALFVVTVSPPIDLFSRHRITLNRPFLSSPYHPQSAFLSSPYHPKSTFLVVTVSPQSAFLVVTVSPSIDLFSRHRIPNRPF